MPDFLPFYMVLTACFPWGFPTLIPPLRGTATRRHCMPPAATAVACPASDM